MKSKKQIKKMLEGYIVGRPVSRSRKFNDFELFLISDYNVMTVYAIDKEFNILHSKKFFSSWYDAFDYYYNRLEILLKD